MNFTKFFSENHWWGKILGAFFGYLIAGAAGAFLGIIIGNFFDSGLSRHFSHPFRSFHSEKNGQVQSIFFEATFSIMGHLAKADGRVSQREIEMANQLMDEMGLNNKQRQLARHFFMQGKESAYNIDVILLNLKKLTHGNPELLKLFMEIQYKSAQVDGLTQGKIHSLDRIFKLLDFAPLRDQPRFYQDFNYNRHDSSNGQRSRQYSSSQRPPAGGYALAEAYAILELSPTANKLEVKRAYRQLISRNHPDKLIAKGLPESMIKLANDKTQKITKAYEQICQSKGW